MNVTSFYVYRYFDPSRAEVIYIGKGKGNRAYTHLKRTEMHPFVQRLQKMKKNNVEPIIDFICKDVDEEFAFLCEIEAISKYGRKDKGLGSLLNLSDGGEGPSGYIPTPETRAKLSAVGRTRKLSESHRQSLILSNSTRVLSEETKRKMGADKVGKQYTPEQRQRMSEGQKKRDPSTQVSGMCGKQHSAETKAKMSATQKGRPKSAEQLAKYHQTIALRRAAKVLADVVPAASQTLNTIGGQQ